MSNQEISQILDVVSNKGLGYFALYIVYHYTGQIVSAIVLLNLARYIVKTIDLWVQRYLTLKEKGK